MSDFYYDVRDVTERFKKWAQNNAILDGDFAVIDGLIQRHYDERGRLFDEMLDTLKRDSDLTSRWQSVCDKGLALNDRLNSAIASKVPDGFRGLGMSDFYEGEKKIWQENRRGTIATIAEIVSDIAKNDEALTKQLEEELKKAREEGRVADELARTTFGEARETIRALTIEAATKGASAAISLIPWVGKALAPKATQLVEILTGGSAKTRELAKRKRAFKDVLISNYDKIEKVREAMNDDNIRNSCQKGSEFAASLKGIGSNGDYKATDWETFSKACSDSLRNRAEPAIQKAKYLFQTVRPAYIEGITGAFATLCSDQSSLDSFKGQLNDDTQKLLDEFSKDTGVINLLHESDPKKSAQVALKKIQDDVTQAIKTLKDAIREAEEAMKK